MQLRILFGAVAPRTARQAGFFLPGYLIFKFGVRRAISFDIPLDVACTGLLMFLFAGTFGGMMAAMVGGLVVSITLLVMKRTMTREELMFVKTKTFQYRSLRWVEVDPS